MAKEHSIRVSARGEFGQLERGLKNLQKDLGGVLGEIDKGARKGGIFDETQLRALDVFKGRFKETIREIDTEFEKQNAIIDKLHKQMEKAYGTEKRNLQDTIDLREKELDLIRRKLMSSEDLYRKRTSEASKYDVQQGGTGPNVDKLNEIGEKSKLDTMFKMAGGFGKGALGLAGIGGVGAILAEAYQQAYSRAVGSMDLAQRIRGSAGYSGSAMDIHDQMRDVGLQNNLGFTSEAVMGVQDIYSSLAGAMNTKDLEHMLTFARGYGLDEFQVSSLLGENVRMSGSESPAQLADAISQSVEQSGMLSRIVEVMETNNALTQELAHTFNNYEAETYLGYQTILDRIGMDNNMYGLTGSQGGDVLSGLAGIFNPQEGNDWKWLGIQALQQYNPEKYGDMTLFQLESAFEDGIANTDNLPAMAKYLREASGGNQEVFERAIQKWLMEGGFQANKRQVTELADVTDNFTVFDSDKVNAIIGQNAQGDATAKYNEERVGEKGQDILQMEAEWQKNLEQVGEQFLDVVTGLKGMVGDMVGDLGVFASTVDKTVDELLRILEDLTGIDFTKAFEFVGDYIMDNWEELAGALFVGGMAYKGGKNLFDKFRGKDKDDDDKDKKKNKDTDKDKTRTAPADPYDEYYDDLDDDKDKKKTTDTEDEKDKPKKKKGKFNKFSKFLDLYGIGTTAFTLVDVAENEQARRDAGQGQWESLFKGGTDALWDNTAGFWMDVFGFDGTSGSFFDMNGSVEQRDANALSEIKEEMAKMSILYNSGYQHQVVSKNATGEERAKLDNDYKTQFADTTWTKHLKSVFGIQDKTSRDGLMETVQIMKTFGIDAEQLPKAMKEALKKENIDYDKVQRVSQEDLALSIKNIKELEVVPGMFHEGVITLQKESTRGSEALSILSANGTLAVDGLSSVGKEALKTLEEQGLLKLQEMNTSSATTLIDFSKKGEAELLKLQEQGLIEIGGLQANGTAKLTALSDEGKVALLDLQEKGIITLGEFDKTGRLKITELTDVGIEQLKILEENGSLSLVGMDKTTKEKLEEMREHTHSKMEEITKEHRTMGQVLSDAFQDWSWENFKKLFTLWKDDEPSTSSGSFGAGSDVTKGVGNVTESQLNAKLDGVLRGHGKTFIEAGEKYGINPGVLAAISMHETGNGSSNLAKTHNNVGGMMGKTGPMSFGSIEIGIDRMADNLKRLYIDQGLTSVEDIQKKYAPLGAENDPSNLNQHWVSGVYKHLSTLGVSLEKGVGKNDFWDGWQKRVTSKFNEDRTGLFGDWSGQTAHKGLDIDGKQGDSLQALAQGIVEEIHMDDGGQYDKDGKKNTRSGGSEVVIRMPNGEKYFYSHLSEIDPGILSRYFAGETVSVQQGQEIAKMGGDKDMPGSGYSTSGSHLHLGYMKDGKLVDPKKLLEELGLLDKGDSDIGKDYIDETQLHAVIEALTQDTQQRTRKQEQTKTSVHTVNYNHTVKLDITGEGATLLNQATVEQLTRLINQVVTEREDRRLAYNPTGGGY